MNSRLGHCHGTRSGGVAVYRSLQQGWLEELCHSTHVIDRTFVTNDGTRWIIDYKSAEPGEQRIEEFLQQEAEAHQPQFTRYKSLVDGKDNNEIVCALYFPNLSLLHKVAV